MYGGIYKTEKIKGFANDTTLSENSWVRNLITPSLAGQWSGGNLALRFKLNLPFQFTYEKATGMRLNTDGYYLVKNGADSDTTTFGFTPNLRLAAQWRALPDKLHLYAGARLNLSNITHVNVDSVDYTTGVATTSTKTITDTFDNTGNQFRLGVTFLPTQNLTFEAACGIGTNNSISVFDPNGLLNFTTLLVGLKF
jgi:hypothetical protein